MRIATLNLEQDHKRWTLRRELILEQLGDLRPDVLALNEVCIPLQTGRWLRDAARDRLGLDYNLVQQSRTNGLSEVEGEALLSRYPVRETANFDFRTRDMVAQVARLQVEDCLVDVYVTHLYMSSGDDSLRCFQVQQLLDWIASRDDIAARIICGDFNATLENQSAELMARHFRPTQTAPTAPTPLADEEGQVSHPGRERMDRCIDYIWISDQFAVEASRVTFDQPSPRDPTLWPSDHAGVMADLRLRR